MASGLNRRIHSRSLTDERAEVVLPVGRLACVVRDRSSGGARLVFRSRTDLPASFTLSARLGSRTVRLIWFDGVQAGVRYEDDASAAAPS